MQYAFRMLSAFTAGALMACVASPTSTTEIVDALFAKGPPQSDTPVTAAFDETPVGLRGDGNTYVNGANGVTSILQAALGDWEMDLTMGSSTRTVLLDFGDPVAGNAGTAPFQSALVKARFIAKASQFTSGGFRGLGSGAAANTPLSVSFSYGGKNYAVRMNSTTHAGSDFARMTCTVFTTACVQWSVTPTNASGKNVGALELIGNRSSTLVGHYRMGFAVTVAR